MRMRIGAALVAGVLAAGACSSDGGEAEPSELKQTITEAIESEADAADGDVAPDGTETAAPVEILGSSTFFDDGTYGFDTLGVSVEFTVTGEWTTQPVGAGYAVITTRDSVSPGDHDVVFLRPVELFDPHSDEAFWPLEDLAGWLAAEPTGLQVSDPVATTVDGIPTTVFDVRVEDDAACRIGDLVCSAFLVVSDDFGKVFDKGFHYRVIWIDASGGPLVLVNGTTDADPGWLDGADGVVESLMIG